MNVILRIENAAATAMAPPQSSRRPSSSTAGTARSHTAPPRSRNADPSSRRPADPQACVLPPASMGHRRKIPRLATRCRHRYRDGIHMLLQSDGLRRLPHDLLLLAACSALGVVISTAQGNSRSSRLGEVLQKSVIHKGQYIRSGASHQIEPSIGPE